MAVLEAKRTELKSASPRVTVLTDRCAGCEECIIRCPTGALALDTTRWVARADDVLCVGCRQCVRTCPFSAIEVEGPALVAERGALPVMKPALLLGDSAEARLGFRDWQAALSEAERCLSCPDPTCVRGCPAHNDIPAFIQALKARDLDAAHRILGQTSVLPDVCSRVCDQSSQCEGSCSWSLAGGKPVAIGALERFICDQAGVPAPVRRTEGAAGLSVGIVGSGPAGVAAAWELVEAGASITVYEKDAEPGGLLLWGIPDFTLPGAVARRAWGQLAAAGVDIRCSTEVRPDQIDRLIETHDAVVLAHGAGAPMRLPVPGADLKGVIDATVFLQEGKRLLVQGGTMADLFAPGRNGHSPNGHGGNGSRPPQVLVLGAGNTGMDVARTARRLGAHAICLDWFDRRFAVVRADELAEAEAEGVEARFATTLVRLEGDDGHVRQAILAGTRQRKATSRPSVLSNTTESIAVDLVVMAMGYRLDPSFATALPTTPVRRQAQGLPDRRWMASGILANGASQAGRRQPVGTLALGREVGLRAAAVPVRERLWVAGDALVGPSTVVEAMAQGRRAAQAILLSSPRRPQPSTASSRTPDIHVYRESSTGHKQRAVPLP